MQLPEQDRGTGRWWRRTLCVGVGVFFAFAALVKIADFDGFLEKAAYYRAVPYVWMVRSAWLTIVVEAALGLLLVAGFWPRRTIAAAAVLLASFSVLVAHAWHAYGITDCGCLGSFAETPPWLGIAKNIAMVAMLAAAWPPRSLTARERILSRAVS